MRTELNFSIILPADVVHALEALTTPSNRSAFASDPFKERYSLSVRARALAIALPASRIASAINSAARMVAPDWTVPSANLFALLRRSLSFGIEQSGDGSRRSRPAKYAQRFC